MSLLGKLAGATLWAGKTIVNAVVSVVNEVVDEAMKYYHDINDREARKERKDKILNDKFKDLSEINDFIIDLEKKKRRDGELRSSDEDDLNQLYEKRDSWKANWDEAYFTHEMAPDIDENPDQYGNIQIFNDNTHILQFHVGQTVMGKNCRVCGLPMILQWRRDLQVIEMKDFFWGCVGFYQGNAHSERFVISDMNLFTKKDRPEFQMTSSELNGLTLLPGPTNIIKKRVNELRREKSDRYLCPIHNEQMILREKKEPMGLLDTYFLGCPRWEPSDQGCSQIIKLKSPAQLASLLEAHTNQGIL